MLETEENSIMLCRCYEVSKAAIDEAIAHGAVTVNDVKRMTRAGMGLCQGIYCVPQISEILHEATGSPMARPPPNPRKSCPWRHGRSATARRRSE